MKTASTTLVDRLKNAHHLRATPKIVFEWNHNRYGGILKVENNPPVSTLDADEDNFPINTIVEAQRPSKGIIKARTSPANAQTTPGPWRRRTNVTGDEGFTTASYTDSPNATRYYTTGPASGYKYWSSPKPSTTNQISPNAFSIPNLQPYVIYKKGMRTNKIVVGLENSWARPTDYDIQVTQNAGATWSTIGSNLIPDKDGRVIIYRQLGGNWSQRKNLSSLTTINGVRLVVRGMSAAGAYFNLIELGARLELDMSPYVVEYDVSMEMSDANFLTPLGKASSNTASVTLSNVNGLFNNENPASIFYGLVDKNILVTCDLEYDLTEVGGTYERVREFTMYVDQWSGVSDLELTAECKDSSKFLQEQKVPQVLLQNITVGEAIWRVCDSVGFGDFYYSRKDADPVSSIEYFWTEKEDTVWDTIQSLAEATQTAVYFDEFDQLQIKTREAAYDLTKTPVWNLEAGADTTILPGSREVTKFYDTTAVRSAIDSTTTISGLVSAWNDRIGVTYGVTLGVKTTDYNEFTYLHQGLTAAYLNDAKNTLKGMAQALSCYPPALVLGANSFSNVDLVGSINNGGIKGYATNVRMVIAVTTSATPLDTPTSVREAYGWDTWHHEFMHVLANNYVDFWYPGTARVRSDWLSHNPPGFSYSGIADFTGPFEPIGFATQYARTTYGEDVAETMSELFGTSEAAASKPRIASRFSDTLLLGKATILINWLANNGIPNFTNILPVRANKLPDIVEANITADYEANVVNITYNTTKTSEDNKGFPQMEVIWTPEDALVLRATRLVATLPANGMAMRLNPKDVNVWPYEGIVNIEGELIRYNGKQYSYYDKAGKIKKVVVRNKEEKINIDKNLSSEAKAFMNTWTGVVVITERGLYWTSPREHSVDLKGWTARTFNRKFLNEAPWQQGLKQFNELSIMRLSAPPNRVIDSVTNAFRGRYEDAPFTHFGTRLKFPSNNRRGSAGICINLGPAQSGYYIEVTPTAVLDASGGAFRQRINEVSMFVRKTDGEHVRLFKGATSRVVGGIWYDLDVTYKDLGTGGHLVTVYLNGIVMIRHVNKATKVFPSGRAGVYVRYSGVADFEYFYAHSNTDVSPADESNVFDKISGGFVSGQWDREHVYGTRSVRRKIGRNTQTYRQLYNQYIYDEFGPIVHEIREMEVPFEKFPVLHSRLYLSNDTQILCPEYNSTSFDAKFMLANTSRTNAVASGEDTLRFGADNPVTQRMMIYGRLVFQEEGQVYRAKADDPNSDNPIKDNDSIRRRGKVEVDIGSKWIQSRAEAEALGKWILKHWSGGSDQIEIEVFGNPLFQLGDIVSVDYPDKNLHSATHRYFIVSKNNSYSAGLSTNLILRRVKN